MVQLALYVRRGDGLKGGCYNEKAARRKPDEQMALPPGPPAAL